MGGHYLWWFAYLLLDGISRQRSHYHWHRLCFHSLMAVSTSFVFHLHYSTTTHIFPRRNTPLTHFPNTPDGDERFSYFSKVVSFHPIQRTLLQQQWDLTGEAGTHVAIALFTFLYVDIIDCTATVYSMARFCSRARKDKADFPRSTMAFCVDAFCISMGSLLGLSPVTAFIESSAGISEGGRTGLTSVSTGICFFISLFFAPIFASIPPWASGSTLILVSSFEGAVCSLSKCG